MKISISRAEKHAYLRGYNAGKKHTTNKANAEQLQTERQAFLDRAYLAVLAAAMAADGWTLCDHEVTTLSERAHLAERMAVEALKNRPLA